MSLFGAIGAAASFMSTTNFPTPANSASSGSYVELERPLLTEAREKVLTSATANPMYGSSSAVAAPTERAATRPATRTSESDKPVDLSRELNYIYDKGTYLKRENLVADIESKMERSYVNTVDDTLYETPRPVEHVSTLKLVQNVGNRTGTVIKPPAEARYSKNGISDYGVTNIQVELPLRLLDHSDIRMVDLELLIGKNVVSVIRPYVNADVAFEFTKNDVVIPFLFNDEICVRSHSSYKLQEIPDLNFTITYDLVKLSPEVVSHNAIRFTNLCVSHSTGDELIRSGEPSEHIPAFDDAFLVSSLNTTRSVEATLDKATQIRFEVREPICELHLRTSQPVPYVLFRAMNNAVSPIIVTSEFKQLDESKQNWKLQFNKELVTAAIPLMKLITEVPPSPANGTFISFNHVNKLVVTYSNGSVNIQH